MNTYIPGTEIAFGVLFVALMVISLGFKFLSLIFGFSVGIPDLEQFNEQYGSRSTSRVKVSDARSRDVR